MRRKILLIASTLILGAVFALTIPLKTYAEESPIKDYWTFSEVLEITQKYNQILSDLCHKDFDCEIQYDAEHGGMDTEYDLAQGFKRSGLLLTSINPQTGKFSLYQNPPDIDPMMALMEDESPDHITSLYLAWTEPDVPEVFADLSWLNIGRPYFVRDFQTGVPSRGTHFVLEAGDTISGEDWLIPESEQEFAALEGNLLLNKTGRVQFVSYRGTNDVVGIFDYSSCLTSPDYQEGMTCSLIFGVDGLVSYLPTELITEPIIESVTEPTTEQPAVELAPEPTAESIIEELALEPSLELKRIVVATQAPNIPRVGTASVSDDRSVDLSPNIPLAAETYALAPRAKSDDFPWWLVILPTMTAIFIAWWFIPTRKKH